MRGYVDLHLHLDGSLPLCAVKELAKINDIALPDDEKLLSMLQVSKDCKSLNEYLEKFAFPLSLLQTKESIALAVRRLQEELKSQGLIYAEIRFAPQLHKQKGLSQQEVIEAAIEGLNQCDFPCKLILCCMRGADNQEENLETIRLASEYLGQGVCAIDLAGAEALYETALFDEVFDLAKTLQVPFTIHAGEADGPESVWKALSYGAKRIGHGVRSIEDPALVKYLAEEKIVLELCPTSNLNTQVYTDIKDYPIRKFMEAGVIVTVNTDNMTVSNTTLAKEWALLQSAFDFTEDEIYKINQDALNAAF